MSVSLVCNEVSSLILGLIVVDGLLRDTVMCKLESWEYVAQENVHFAAV